MRFGDAEYLRLESDWYARLREVGFIDIEKNGRLLAYSSSAYRGHNDREVQDNKSEYFSALGEHLVSASFDSAQDKAIMELWAEGRRNGEISRVVGLSRWRVRFRVRKYEQRWGIRRYPLHKLDNHYGREKVKVMSSYSVLLYAGRDLPDRYSNLILSKWLRSLRYGNEYLKKIDKEAYFKHFTEVINGAMQHPLGAVRLAVLTEDHDVVLGFSVHRGAILDYVYVNREYRKQGIGRALVPPGVAVITSMTKIGQSILGKIPNPIKFNPYF